MGPSDSINNPSPMTTSIHMKMTSTIQRRKKLQADGFNECGWSTTEPNVIRHLLGTENASFNCSCRGFSEVRFDRMPAARVFQYTLPVCHHMRTHGRHAR